MFVFSSICVEIFEGNVVQSAGLDVSSCFFAVKGYYIVLKRYIKVTLFVLYY